MAIDVEKILKEEADKRESGLIAIRDETGKVMEFMKTLDQKVSTLDEYIKKQVMSRKAGISQSAMDLMTSDAALLPEGEPKKKFSFCRGVMAALNPTEADANGCNYELEMMRETKKSLKQALTLDVGSTGGFLVPIQQLPEMIEQLKARSVTKLAGARIMRDLTGSPVTIARKTASATAQWINAGTTLTNSQQTFDQVSLSVKRLAALTVLDNLTLRMSLPSLDEIVEQDLGEELALGVDLAGLRGLGAASEPLGVRFSPGVSLRTIGGTQVPTVSNMQTLVQLLNEANAPNRNRGWIMTPRTLKTIQDIVDASGRPILAPGFDPSPGNVQTILTLPFWTTTQIPNNLGGGSDESELYLGDWSELLIGEWGAMEILASNVAGSAFASDQTFVRAILYTDIAVRHGASFAIYTDVQLT